MIVLMKDKDGVVMRRHINPKNKDKFKEKIIGSNPRRN